MGQRINQKGNKKYLETNENKNRTMGCYKSNSEREFYSDRCIY